MHPLILASTSRYRAELLARLGIPFEPARPDVDETPHPGEDAAALALRLAVEKARAVSVRFPEAWVLGSDQAAECEGRLLGKPGDRERARGQLRGLSGRQACFVTAVALVRGTKVLRAVDRTEVRMRALEAGEIERYLDREPAFDCAGSFKMEGLGISLFERIDSQDPSALIGLPLIACCRLLREAGYALP